MSPSYLIDTVILIEHLMGVKDATNWLDGLGEEEAVLSVVTRAEVLVGVEPDEEVRIKLFLGA